MDKVVGPGLVSGTGAAMVVLVAAPLCPPQTDNSTPTTEDEVAPVVPTSND